MPNQFFSPEGDLETYFVTDYWLIDQYIGDQLWTWGRGDNGQLGNAIIATDRSTPVTTISGGTNWKQVSCSRDSTAAIKTDGTLWVWGSNDSRQLGNNTTNAKISTPITTFAGGTDWKQVSVSAFNMAAVKTDGTLWTWGYNGRGQLGIGNDISNHISTPVTTSTGGTNWKQVSVGYYHTAALKTDGTLWTWGDYFSELGMLGKGDYFSARRDKPSSIFQATTNWADTATTESEDLYTISAGYNFSSAIKTDGTLWIWGSAVNGRLGNGITTGNISTPITTFAGGSNWKQVCAGEDHAAAIKTDGTLWTWGNGGSGRLGNAVTTNVSTPVTTFAGGTNWKQVSSGELHIVAIKTDGTLWTWGNGANGRLGNAVTTGNRSTPITTFAGGTNWKQSLAIFSSTFAIKTDGTLWSWGSGNYGQLGNGITTGNISTPITTFAGGTDWKQIGGGANTGTPVAIKTDGTLWAWGLGGQGRLGNGIVFGSRSTPITTFAGGTNWKQVTNGRDSTLAIKTDGTLWAWGIGSIGQLGNGTKTSGTSTPVTTFAGGTDWKQVSGGFDHNTALKGTSPNLQIFSFGSAAYGQMGDGFNIQTNYAPGQVFGNSTNWKNVSAGYHNTAAIKTDGTLWVWGYNLGNLGVGDLNDKNTPVTTFAGGTNWKQVITGGYYNDYMRMFAIKTDGTLWSWGSQRRGSLANFVDSNEHVSTPITTFAGGTNWKYVDVGPQITSAIKTDGTLWTWGTGFNSQLGNANTTDRSTPVTTFAGGTNWKQVGSGGYHVAAIQSGISAEYPLS